MATTGVTSGDFDQIHSDFARTVSYQVVTKTINPTTGDETSSYSTSSNVDAIFFLQDKKYIFDKEGLLEVGDAYLIAKTSVGIKRYDKFTIDTQTYIIENVIRRHVTSVAMQDYAVCFKVN
jgi:hypothetical protein